MAKGKRCAECRRHRGIGQFNPNPFTTDRLQTLCKECLSARIKQAKRGQRRRETQASAAKPTTRTRLAFGKAAFTPEFPGGKVFPAPASVVANGEPKPPKRRRVAQPPTPAARDLPKPSLDRTMWESAQYRADIALAHLGLARLAHPDDPNLHEAQRSLSIVRVLMPCHPDSPWPASEP